MALTRSLFVLALALTAVLAYTPDERKTIMKQVAEAFRDFPEACRERDGGGSFWNIFWPNSPGKECGKEAQKLLRKNVPKEQITPAMAACLKQFQKRYMSTDFNADRQSCVSDDDIDDATRELAASLSGTPLQDPYTRKEKRNIINVINVAMRDLPGDFKCESRVDGRGLETPKYRCSNKANVVLRQNTLKEDLTAVVVQCLTDYQQNSKRRADRDHPDVVVPCFEEADIAQIEAFLVEKLAKPISDPTFQEHPYSEQQKNEITRSVGKCLRDKDMPPVLFDECKNWVEPELYMRNYYKQEIQDLIYRCVDWSQETSDQQTRQFRDCLRRELDPPFTS